MSIYSNFISSVQINDFNGFNLKLMKDFSYIFKFMHKICSYTLVLIVKM